MDSDKNDDDEHEAISKQILEYYKNYSLSQQLPKYFSGTPLSYMPKIVKDEEVNKPLIIIEDTISSSETLIRRQSENCQIDIENVGELKTVSPASSVTSVRKLEWDSGADIGYNNCNKTAKLHKSSSLPALTGLSDCKTEKKPSKTKLSSHIINIISYSNTSNNVSEKVVQSSSSSAAEPLKEYFSSSFSAKPSSVKPTSSSSSSSARPPLMQSESSSSFASTLAFLKSKIGSPDAESTPKIIAQNNNMNNSSIETPLQRMYKRVHKKIVDLCATKPFAIECTDNKQKRVLDKRVQTSLVEKISKSVQTGEQYEEKSEESGTKKILHGPRDNQSIIIMYYEDDQKMCSSNTQTDSELTPPSKNGCKRNLRKTEAASNLVTTSNSSKEIPLLGQLISKKQSKSLTEDVDKSIELLQKLLKSKKYDAATKKRYIKKIVNKIVDNKYAEDSTTSSELFKPKRQNTQNLEENIPWYPPKLSKFEVQTFRKEFLQKESKNRSMFTVTEAGATSTSVDNCTSLEEQKTSTASSYQSWKEDKTLSEILLEEKQKAGGDQLVNFAQKERQNQIAWINDEITHLTKLKGLLERNGVDSTTTVYMVSQQYDKNACIPTTCSSRGRSYVIKTELSQPTSAEEVADFNLYEESKENNYQMENTVTMGRGEKMLGDIEVVSDDQTTSIKVKARKVAEDKRMQEFHPKKPTLVGLAKYDTYPRSKKEEERCWPCGIMKARRFEGLSGQRYSFDVPITENAAAIIKKVDEIVNKYGSKSSDSSGKITHVCTCKREMDVASRQINVAKSRTDCNCQTTNNFSDKQTTTNGQCIYKDTSAQTDRYNNEDKKVQPDELLNCFCKQGVDIPSIDIKESTHSDESPKLICHCHKETANVGVQCTCSEDSKNSTASKSEEMSGIFISSTATSSSRCPSTASATVHSCICCKRKNVTAKALHALRKKLSEDAYPLCRPCYRQNKTCSYSYNTYINPGHVCKCYTMVQTKTLNAIKKTITDLEVLEEYCACVNSENRLNSSCCRYCKKKLKETSRNKNGIAYLVTFEDTMPTVEQNDRKTSLEEIRIKIPVVRKKHKEKENRRRKESWNGDGEEVVAKNVGKSPNCPLQEYLKKNRPSFVETAEERRKSVRDSRVQREQVCDQNKLMFLQNHQKDRKNFRRLFSAKEMKEITRRNYKRLPEVQRKLVCDREKKIRQANRLIADTFNRRLKERVLRGKRSLPTDVNVVTL